jgi:hypothetical protein
VEVPADAFALFERDPAPVRFVGAAEDAAADGHRKRAPSATAKPRSSSTADFVDMPAR